jgi:diguanylate cyclase (GGDEF)-like protein
VLAFAREQLGLARRLDLPLSLALIDIDRFKQINDRHGHAVGDRVLVAFVRAVARELRGQDRLGRWGGEEWLLVMPGTPGAELPNVFERLRERYRAMQVAGLPHPHGCTFSLGCATASPGEPATLAALIAQADANLYRAKAEGRDAVRR